MSVAGPLFSANQVRIDDEGAPVVEARGWETKGRSVLVLGAPRALFEAAAGLRPVSRGELFVAGAPSARALREGMTAAAPLDPPLPSRWTVREYVAWSARLSGGDEKNSVPKTLAALALEPFAATRLGDAVLAVRRAVVIAAAFATEAPALLLEDPSVGLNEDVAVGFARQLVFALGGRAWLLFLGRASLSSPLVQAADEALLFGKEGVVEQGTPASVAGADRRYALRVRGDARALARALRAAGALAEAYAHGLVVTLSETQSTRDVFALALETSCAIVELRSVGRAFA